MSESLNPEPLIRRILAFVEFAERREPDMSYAILMAEQLGAELILFGVIDTPAMVSMIGRHGMASREQPGPDRRENFDESLVQDAKAVLSKIVDEAATRGVRALGHATVGEDVEEQILKEALVQKVDLILVRSKGRGTLMKALLGSTAGEILKAAPCPVLVARA